ncbi:membrane protease YdiL (CAAX protease family) [Oxalobacteraceae bacterium GrIS 1.11]
MTALSIWLTFGLLGLSICSVWLPSVALSTRINLAPWMILFGAAFISALSAGYVKPIGVLELALFGLAVRLAAGPGRPWSTLAAWIGGILALALAMHRLPGFNNPLLIANVKFSVDSIPFTQYANFDKAAVGLILLALLCARAKTWADWRDGARRALPVAVATAGATLLIASVIGYVRPEFKLSWFTPIFLATNLLFTCVAEEAFFRGFLQERLARFLSSTRMGQKTGAVITVLASGILFGAAHIAGGPILMALASVAGIAYAYVYAVVKRIEAPIIAHFLFNTIHFIAFSYPHLQSTT